MRTYHIIIGSKSFFEKQLKNFLKKNDGIEFCSFLELVSLNDAHRKIGKVFNTPTQFLLIKNSDYHGIVDSAHDRLGSLIEELTEKDSEIFVHNPPRTLYDYLNGQKERSLIYIEEHREEYDIFRNTQQFANSINQISHNIIGQEKAVTEVSKSLWYLTTVKRQKPYVIMLYGNSGLGKTELVREISVNFFDSKLLEKHLSMFKNDNYADYFFGESPNRRSLGFDLLERESNLIFFDELDKCPEYFYSVFYTLFDNAEFKDATYDVNVSGAVIILTSNFHNMEEMQKSLGMPIFYRIDKFIHFQDFSAQTIYDVTQKEIKSKEIEYQGKITPEEIYCKVSNTIKTHGENARTIKFKVQQVIEDLLFEEITKL